MQQDTDIPDDLKLLNQIDEVCDAFEKSWKSGNEPDIGEFLHNTSVEVQSTLFVELVKVDLAYRANRGEKLTPRDYALKYPEFEETISVVGLAGSGAEPLTESAKIGRLKLIKRAGRGAFGTVWKAWDQIVERFVAVKIPHAVQDEQAQRAFQHEAKAAAGLSHPGIVSVYEADVDDGLPYIVTEFVDGTNLKDWTRKHRPTPRQSVSICAQIAGALAHAHDRGVVHRDLKPANILMNEADQPLIADFGLAKQLDATSTLADAGTILGTLAYMSPEQAVSSDSVDGRSDVYGVGAILYELLAGRRVFEVSAARAVHCIQNVIPDPVSRHNPEIADDLDIICQKALQKQPDRRYSSAAEMQQDLERYLNGESIVARPPSLLSRVSQSVFNNPSRSIMCLLIAALLFVVTSQQSALWPSATATSVPDGHRRVEVSTEPAGAQLQIFRYDQFGEIDIPSHVVGESPLIVDLRPGSYLVRATHDNQFLEVERTVPNLDTTHPVAGTNNGNFHLRDDGITAWPALTLTPASVTSKMVFVKGTDRFELEPGVYVSIPDFWVSPREFTYGDYFRLRPQDAGILPADKPRGQQPAQNTMTETYDFACHWAEASGGRLLTEIEFQYLAELASQSLSKNDPTFDADLFHTAGAETTDAIVTPTGTISGILSGYAEWTFSRCENRPGLETLETTSTHDARIVRGGGVESALHGVPARADVAHVRSRIVASRWKWHPGVGFRIARTALPGESAEYAE